VPLIAARRAGLLQRMSLEMAPNSRSGMSASCPLLGGEADSICSVWDFPAV